MRNSRECSVEGCGQKHRSKGYCGKHYTRLRKHGDPTAILIMDRTLNPQQRLEQAGWDVQDSGCWVWKGSRNSHGYGTFSYRDRYVMAHRVAFEVASGPIPAGFEIDHICHNRACVNPSHLRLATPKQNSENFSGPMRNNTSGVRGVYRSKKSWAASVGHNGRRHYLGSFRTLQEAETAVIAKRNELFTHNVKDRL